jgi:hydrogenase-1 operon protein HyaF
MSGLTSIPITVEPIEDAVKAWGNSKPILHEIRYGLKRLAESGESTKIDLNSIPFGPGDEERLLAMLGKGEVEANVDALGPTRVWESAIHGVWLIDYRNLDEQRLALHIEIATVPDILGTQPQDIHDAIDKLETLIETVSGDSDPKS